MAENLSEKGENSRKRNNPSTIEDKMRALKGENTRVKFFNGNCKIFAHKNRRNKFTKKNAKKFLTK